MPVSSVVISCQPGKAADIECFIRKLAQIEMHRNLENGLIIAVLDTDTVDAEVSLVKEIMQAEGVLDVRLAYHNFEDLQEQQK